MLLRLLSGSSHRFRVRLGLSLGLTLLAAAAATRSMSDHPAAGWQVLRLVYPFDASVETAGIKSLPLTVTLPARSDQLEAAAIPVTAAPTILLFNGFKVIIEDINGKLKASFYRAYAQQLATAGYAVVQYDTPLLKTPTDATEVRWLRGILDWLQQQVEDPQSSLGGALNLKRLGTAGHSRGAKLAALHFADNPHIHAAYLLDPVDNTSRTPEGPDYPSASAALRTLGKPVAVTGAGIVGPCNPEGCNYKVFFNAVSDGSWLTDVTGAGHTTFLQAPWLVNKALDLLCHRGEDSHQEATKLAARPMVAWFDRHLKTSIDCQKIEDDFFAWVKAEEQLGKIAFEVKGAWKAPQAGHADAAHPAPGHNNIVPFPRQQGAPEAEAKVMSD